MLQRRSHFLRIDLQPLQCGVAVEKGRKKERVKEQLKEWVKERKSMGRVKSEG